MLLVKTKIGPSKIHGIGIFADEFIPKGTIVWKFVPGFDLKLTKEGVKKLPEPAREFFLNYCYLSYDTGYYILCTDNARFYNHSKNPNTTGVDLEDTENEGGDIATRDIKEGEEITYDYESGDADYRRKLGQPEVANMF